jgi:hypothetical protein
VLPRMASASRAFGSSAPRALASPAEQQAQASEGGNPNKPAHYKDVSIYRWVSGDAAEEDARRLQQLRIGRICALVLTPVRRTPMSRRRSRACRPTRST